MKTFIQNIELWLWRLIKGSVYSGASSVSAFITASAAHTYFPNDIPVIPLKLWGMIFVYQAIASAFAYIAKNELPDLPKEDK